jgi:hypothetical protein
MIAGTIDAALASMNEWWISEQQCAPVNRCLQLFSGHGYMLEYPIARMYVDARIDRSTPAPTRSSRSRSREELQLAAAHREGTCGRLEVARRCHIRICKDAYRRVSAETRAPQTKKIKSLRESRAQARPYLGSNPRSSPNVPRGFRESRPWPRWQGSGRRSYLYDTFRIPRRI